MCGWAGLCDSGLASEPDNTYLLQAQCVDFMVRNDPADCNWSVIRSETISSAEQKRSDRCRKCGGGAFHALTLTVSAPSELCIPGEWSVQVFYWSASGVTVPAQVR